HVTGVRYKQSGALNSTAIIDPRRPTNRCGFSFECLPEAADAPILRQMITLLIGTNRPENNSRKVARHVEEIYAELKVPLRVLDLTHLPSEIFLPTSYAEKPKSFQPFAEAVLQSSGLHVLSPEYNGGIPGVLKYFIDMLKFPESFERRPVCFTGLSAGIWGALRPVEQLQAIFGYRNAFIYPERVFLPQINSLLDENGRLQSADLLDRLRKQAEGFVDFVEKVKQVKLRGTAK
ncbi:MAG TPA: NADPH-dependent FMN reductase, partial [Verrucomicrobiae bacterium]